MPGMKRVELKRKTPLRAKAPMAHTSTFNRKQVKKNHLVTTAQFDLEVKNLWTASKWKSKGPKMTPIRRAARGEECTLLVPGVCNRDPDTVVLCHSNRLADGKGMGLKAPDLAACFGCSACHDLLDGRRPLPPGLTHDALQHGFDAAVVRTHARLRAKGIEV